MHDLDPLIGLTPSSDYCLSGLHDHELLASTRRMVGRSNQVLAGLLAHLAEVEARGLHRLRACSSLYTCLLNQARDLLAHADSGRSLEAIHLRAMRLLVADLRKRKYAVTEKPRAAGPSEQRAEQRADPRQRGRHIPARVRRQVAERDGERCTYVDERGQRCRETSGLELAANSSSGRRARKGWNPRWRGSPDGRASGGGMISGGRDRA